MGVTINGPQFGEDVESVDDLVDTQPYGEAFTHAWRLEHVARADAALAGVDLILEHLAELADDEHPDPRDLELTRIMIDRAAAGYAAANVRAQHVPPISDSDVATLNLLAKMGVGPAAQESYERTLKEYGPKIAGPLRPRDDGDASG